MALSKLETYEICKTHCAELLCPPWSKVEPACSRNSTIHIATGMRSPIGCRVQFIKSDSIRGKVLHTGVHCPGCNAKRSRTKCWRLLKHWRRVISQSAASVCAFVNSHKDVCFPLHPLLSLPPTPPLPTFDPHLPLPTSLQTILAKPAVSVW